MQDLFNRIQASLNQLKVTYGSDEDFYFNPPASPEAFAALEQALGLPLPDDLKTLYQVHNGTQHWGGINGEEWLSLEDALAEYQIWRSLFDSGSFQDQDGQDYGCQPDHPAIKADFWFNPKWLPLTTDGFGNGKMIDLDPTVNGRAGQVIQLWHDDPSRSLEAPSLTAFFEQFAQDLENDVYAIHPDYDGLVKTEEFSDEELADLKGANQ